MQKNYRAAAATTKQARPAAAATTSQAKKVTNQKKPATSHFWQVAPTIDYEAELNQAGLYFSADDGEKLMTLSGGPMPRMNQAEYEKVGDIVTGYIQQVMKTRFNMQEVWVGDDSKPNAPKVNIFLSDDFYTNAGRCLVLIQGTGAVRAGQWARSLCVNESLTMGSMLPMLEFAKATGQSVIVFNPNMAKDPLSGVAVPHCDSMDAHCRYIWERFMNRRTCPATSITLMAHSAGGRCTASLLKNYKADFMARVQCLVFTDAYYHAMFQGLSVQEKTKLSAIGIHFKAYQKAHKEVGEAFQNQNGPIQEVSAGTNQHASTTGKSLEAVLAFMAAKLLDG